MLNGNLLRSNCNISSYHLQATMTKYLLQEEYVAPVNQILCGKRMAAEMDMEALNFGSLGEPGKDQLHGVGTHRLSIQR